MEKKEYIERGALLQKNMYGNTAPITHRTYAEQLISTAPAADVVEVRHGTWCVTDAYPHNVYCSECYKRIAQEHWEIWKDGSLPRDYCPSCGAKEVSNIPSLILRSF